MADEKNMFVDMEHEVMDFWEKEKCFEKLREKNRGHKMFRFLDGPITANNPMGIHHAWGRSIKDIFIRYHAMQGLFQPQLQPIVPVSQIRFGNGNHILALHDSE